MKLLILKILALVLFVNFIPKISLGQQFADKKYYLIDSLNLSQLSVDDKNLIDSVLPLYHKSNSDTARLGYINKITEACIDDNIWPKYNQLAYDKAQQMLSNPLLSKKQIVFTKKIVAAALNNMGYLDYMLGNSTKAIKHYKLSLAIYTKIHDKAGLSACYNNIGSIYDDQGKTQKALKCYLTSLKFVKLLADKKGIALALNNIGYIYSNMGKIQKALAYYQQSIKLLTQIDDRQVLATTYNNIGYIYKTLNDNKNALRYYKKCLSIFKKLNNKEGIAGSLNNLATIYSLIDSTVSMSLQYYKQSFAIQKALGNKKGLAETAINIGSLYEREKNNKLALKYYNISLKNRKEINDKVGITISLTSIGQLQMIRGNLLAAKKNALKSFKIANELNFPTEIQNAAKLLSNIYGLENNKSKELEMYKLYIKMKDRINNDNNRKAAIEHEVQYKYDKQALADSIATAETEKIKDLKYTQRIKEQKTYTIAGIISFLLMTLVVLFVFRGYYLKKKSNLILGAKNKVIEEKNIEITDSINYAKRIQTALLPPINELNKHLLNGFVLYKPKDIVAGDFYWLEQVGDIVLYAAADCTGHGVPGALVSVVCNNALNRAVKEYQLTEPAAILNKSKEIIIKTFQRSGDGENIRDGMDIALCTINFNKLELQFSGANNPLYIIRDAELIEIKGDKQPIGKHFKNFPFTNHIFKLQNNDIIYTFSDGFADQFGGPKGKKFMYKRFRELLITIHQTEMKKQKEILLQTFNDWKGNLEQIDDVCIIGVKI